MFSFSVRSLYLMHPVPSSVLHQLLAFGNYHNVAMVGLTVEQVPSLLLCTSLRGLAITDPRDVSDEVIEQINSSLPNLQSFSIRKNYQTKVVRQTPGAPPFAAFAGYPGPPPFAKGPPPKGPPGPPPHWGWAKGPPGPPPAPKPAPPPMPPMP